MFKIIMQKNMLGVIKNWCNDIVWPAECVSMGDKTAVLCYDIHTSMSTLKRSTLSALSKYADFSR